MIAEPLMKVYNLTLAKERGEPIQCRRHGSSEWLTANSIQVWYFGTHEYRKLPQPRKFVINLTNKDARGAEQAGIAYPVGSLLVNDNWIMVTEDV